MILHECIRRGPHGNHGVSRPSIRLQFRLEWVGTRALVGREDLEQVPKRQVDDVAFVSKPRCRATVTGQHQQHGIVLLVRARRRARRHRRDCLALLHSVCDDTAQARGRPVSTRWRPLS